MNKISSNVKEGQRYWLQLGPLSSHYIDENIEKVKNMEQSDINDLRKVLTDTDRKLFVLENQVQSTEALKRSICNFELDFQEKTIVSEQKRVHKSIIEQIESNLNQCDEGKVPLAIKSTFLSKICKSLTTSDICDSHLVRYLFNCEIMRPRITLQNVELKFKLIMQHPVADKFLSFTLNTIPVNIVYDAFIHRYNLMKVHHKVV